MSSGLQLIEQSDNIFRGFYINFPDFPFNSPVGSHTGKVDYNGRALNSMSDNSKLRYISIQKSNRRSIRTLKQFILFTFTPVQTMDVFESQSDQPLSYRWTNKASRS